MMPLTINKSSAHISFNANNNVLGGSSGHNQSLGMRQLSQYKQEKQEKQDKMMQRPIGDSKVDRMR